MAIGSFLRVKPWDRMAAPRGVPAVVCTSSITRWPSSNGSRVCCGGSAAITPAQAVATQPSAKPVMAPVGARTMTRRTQSSSRMHRRRRLFARPPISRVQSTATGAAKSPAAMLSALGRTGPGRKPAPSRHGFGSSNR